MGHFIYILIYFIEALIAFYYFVKKFDRKKQNIVYLCIALVISQSLQIEAYSFNNTFLNLALFSVFNFCIIMFFFSTSFFSALMHSMIMCACMGLSEIMIAFLFGGLLALYDDVADMPFVTAILFILLSKLLYFICLYLISNFSTRDDSTNSPTNKSRFVILFTTLLSFAIFLALAYISFHNVLTIVSQYTMILISILQVLFICFVVWIYEYLREQSEKILLLELDHQKNLDAKNYNLLMVQQADELKMLRHDIKNHLLTIQGMYSSESFEEADTYISNLLQADALTSYFQPTNCDTLNLILARYYSLCRDNHISFQTNAQNSDIRFLAFEEITSLFCNLLDNAFEASVQCANPYIDLNITDSKDNHKTIITVVNSCNSAPLYDKNKEVFISSKGNPDNHGFGQRSIQRVLEKYNGKFDAYYLEEKKEFHTILYLYSPQERISE